MNWFHLIKESLSISDIFNNAIPNFYNRVIDIHPDMKEFLDEEANEFRTRYLNYLKKSPSPENPTEEELFTEILLLCMEMQKFLDQGEKGTSLEILPLAEIMRVIPLEVVKKILNKLISKFNLPRELVIEFSYFVRVVLYGFTVVSQRGLQSNISKSWKNTLIKNQVQTQRQGVSAKQKDEEFIFEDDDDDCYQKLISFLRSKGLQGPKMGWPSDWGADLTGGADLHIATFSKQNPKTKATISYDKANKPSDEVCCNVLDILYHHIKDAINWDQKEAGPGTGYSPIRNYYISRGEQWSEFWGGNLNKVSYNITYDGSDVLEYEIFNPVQVKEEQL